VTLGRPPEVRFRVRLIPRGGIDRVESVVDGVLRARVAAPPVDEAANRALVRLIATELDVPPRSVRLVAGQRGRVKVIAVAAIDPGRVSARWPGLAT
jgi:uncharacterized protein YggU (UPF0235/DUF167 family)